MSGAYAIRSLVCAVFVVPMDIGLTGMASLGSTYPVSFAGRRYDAIAKLPPYGSSI